MVDIHVDTDKLVQRMRDMAATIRDFGAATMPEELTAWQREDMHRKFPNIDVINYQRVETEIWPRSRGSNFEAVSAANATRSRVAPRGRTATQRGGRPAPKTKWLGRGRAATHRPILRPELFEKLSVRMRDKMKSQITWRSTTRL